MDITRGKNNFYKVAVWDWTANNKDGEWVITHVSIRTKAMAQAIVDDYARNEGKVARWSSHFGGTYHYAR